MTYTRIVLALLMLTPQVASQPVEQLPAAVATYHAPMAGITVVGGDAERERVENAVAVFATFGMSLPNLEIRFWDDRAKCNGYLGWFSPSSLPWTIEICSEMAMIIPHELSHAWERATLTDADRHTYMEARGFDVWQDLALDPNLTAMENVALVVQQVISKGGPTGRTDIDPPFDLLTTLATN